VSAHGKPGLLPYLKRIDRTARRRFGNRFANVLQGAVRPAGFASSPTPETQVQVAWANTDSQKMTDMGRR